MTAAPIGEAGEGGVIVLSDITETWRSPPPAARGHSRPAHRSAQPCPAARPPAAGARQRSAAATWWRCCSSTSTASSASTTTSATTSATRCCAWSRERLQASVRAGDTVARWGGDEFIVLMDNLRDHGAAVVAGGAQAHRPARARGRDRRRHRHRALVQRGHQRRAAGQRRRPDLAVDGGQGDVPRKTRRRQPLHLLLTARR